MFHKCVLLESQNRTEDFVEAGIQLFSKYFRDVYFNEPDENESKLIFTILTCNHDGGDNDVDDDGDDYDG